MAIAFDVFSTSSVGKLDLSHTHTPSGTPRGVIVYVVTEDVTGDEVSTVDYGSLRLTEATDSPLIRTVNESGSVHCFVGLASIPTGAQTVLVTVAAGGANKKSYCYTFTASDDTEIVDTVSYESASDQNPRETLLLGGVSCYCLQCNFSGRRNTDQWDPLTGWTNRDQHDWGASTCGTFSYDTIGTANVTIGYDAIDADDVLLHGIAIREAAAAAAVVRVKRFNINQAVNRASTY